MQGTLLALRLTQTLKQRMSESPVQEPSDTTWRVEGPSPSSPATRKAGRRIQEDQAFRAGCAAIVQEANLQWSLIPGPKRAGSAATPSWLLTVRLTVDASVAMHASLRPKLQTSTLPWMRHRDGTGRGRLISLAQPRVLRNRYDADSSGAPWRVGSQVQVRHPASKERRCTEAAA